MSSVDTIFTKKHLVVKLRLLVLKKIYRLTWKLVLMSSCLLKLSACDKIKKVLARRKKTQKRSRDIGILI